MKGGVYGVTRGLHARFGAGSGVRHAARRDLDPRARARSGRQRLRPDPGDPVPRLPPQRRGPAARRGGDAAVLLAGRVPQRDGDPDRRATATSAASAGTSTTTTRVGVLRDIPGLVIASPARAGRRRADAAHVRRRGEGGRQRLRLPRADRAVPHARPARGGGRAAGSAAPGGEHVPVGAARTHLDGGDLTLVTLGERSADVAAGRTSAGGARDPGARRRPPLAGADAARRRPARGVGHRARARRRRDAAHRAASAEGSSRSCVDAGYAGRLARVASKDSFVPLGDAANLVLLSEAEIESAAIALAE